MQAPNISLPEYYSNRRFPRLLSPGSSNAKMAKKAKELGILSYNLSLSPSDSSGYQVCPAASPACSANCLAYCGNGKFNSVQESRKRKTVFLVEHKKLFLELLHEDISWACEQAIRKELELAIRLNCFSDVPWERALNLESYSAQFYDYTKHYGRMVQFARGDFPENYYITFSRSEKNEKQALRALELGVNVSVLFKNKLELSSRDSIEGYWKNYSLIDGDVHDYRFLDPRPAVVALKPKGLAKNDTSGFVVLN